VRWLALSWAAALALVLSLAAGSARADLSFTHVVRSGETLASIAQRYYGDPRRESVLVAENGLDVQGGAPIVTGLRLSIPYVSYHRVQEGETWPELAARFLGDSRRAFALIEANGGNASEQPAEGAEVLIPYPLRHIVAQHENILRIAKLYYGASTDRSRDLRRYNFLRTNRIERGQVLLIPLSDLTLSEEGRDIIEDATGRSPSAGDVRAMQERVNEQLPALRAYLRAGNFAEAVALGNRLLGTGVLTGNQVVTIERELGIAYVALERDDLAVQAFVAAIQRQPDLQLDQVETSPTVLAAFRQALEAHRQAVADAAARDVAAVDAGVAPATAP